MKYIVYWQNKPIKTLLLSEFPWDDYVAKCVWFGIPYFRTIVIGHIIKYFDVQTVHTGTFVLIGTSKS